MIMLKRILVELLTAVAYRCIVVACMVEIIVYQPIKRTALKLFSKVAVIISRVLCQWIYSCVFLYHGILLPHVSPANEEND